MSNKATSSAGVVAADSYSNVMTDDSIFTNNTAGHDGGVLYAHTGCSIVVNR